MTREDYFLLLLEEAHNARLYASLQMQDQQLTTTIKSDKYNITAQNRRKKVRVDIGTLGGIIQVQTNLINSQIEKTYDVKFTSFTAEDYNEIITEAQQVQKPQDDGAGANVRLEEGSESRASIGAAEEGNAARGAGEGSPLSISHGGNDQRD